MSGAVNKICRTPECTTRFDCLTNRQVYCTKRCRNKHLSRLRRELNPNESRLANIKSYYKHQTTRLQSQRHRYSNNLEIERRRSSMYHYLNPEKARARTSKYNKTEKARTYSRAWSKANRVKVNKYSRDYELTHPGYWVTKSAIRRARLNSTKSTLTREGWNLIKELWDFKCAYCGKFDRNLTQDHVIPIVSGGEHTPENIVPACGSCNSKKGSQTLGAFLQSL